METINSALDLLAEAFGAPTVAGILDNEDRFRWHKDQLAALSLDPETPFHQARVAGRLAVSCDAFAECGEAWRARDTDWAIGALEVGMAWFDRAKAYVDRETANAG